MSDPRTLGPWLRRFLAEYIVTERNLARNTQKSYRDTFALLLPFVGAKARKPVERIAVQDLTARHVRQFLDYLEDDRGCSVQTRNQRLSAIRAFARFIASRDPGPIEWSGSIRAIASKKAAPKPIGWLSKTEMKEPARGPGPPNAERPRRTRPAPLPLQHRGTRLRNDAARGRRSANRTTRRRASARQHPRQGRKTPTVSAVAPDRSRAHRALAGTGSRGCRLPQPAAKVLYSVGIYRLVERSAARVSSLAGRRITPHTIRLTSACHLLQAGIDLNTIRAWLGHASLDTTNIYAEIDMEMKARAMALCDAAEPGSDRPWRANTGLIAFLAAL